MEKKSVFLGLATFALFSLVACKKDQTTLNAKDSRETEFLAQESADAELFSVAPTQKKKSWVVPLSGANEVPANLTQMVGEARVNLYQNGPNYWYTYNILLKNIPGGTVFTGAHIHEASAGVNGPVRFQLLKTSAPTVGSLANFGIKGQRVYITNAQFLDLLNGIKPFYINVHTTVYPGGAIRGQM